MSNAAFYREQANIQQAGAAEATLDMVRVRCERAAASWTEMANRAERTETARRDRQSAADDAAALNSVE